MATIGLVLASLLLGFPPREMYNIDASRMICNGRGASGARSDIAHNEITHVMCQSVASAFTAGG